MNKRRAIVLAAAVVGAVVLALAGSVARLQEAVAQSADVISIAARERRVSGRSEGEVLIGDTVVIRLRSSSAGQSAPERARRVADRLERLADSGRLTDQDIRVASRNGEWSVLAGNDLIVTADSYEASLNRTTPRRLATAWRNNIARAVAGQVAGYREEPETRSKIVPIVSIGSGVRVGGALVSGPRGQVDETSVVGQVETTFEDVVRIRIFVPLQSITNLSRVQQVNVRGYGDIRL